MVLLKMGWAMTQKNRWMLCFMFWAFMALSACAEQGKPSSTSPEMLAPSNTLQSTKTAPTEALRPSKTPKPTNTLYPTWTPKATATAAPDLCVKNPVPPELLISKPIVENNKLIAFSSKFRTVKNWRRSDIYTIAFDGSNLKQLTTYSGDDDMYSWTPDGKQILFHSDRSHELYEEGEPGYLMEPFKKELFIINVDGSGSRKVAADLPYYPGRSPDGRFIVYTDNFYDELRLEHGLGDYLSNVFVENISGSYKRNLTTQFQPASFGRIDWSPDGKHFAFSGVTEHMVGNYWPVHVYLANADGSNLQRLDKGGAFRDDNYGYQEKAWSSDGKQLAFLTHQGIAIINADGSGFSEYKLENNSYARDIFWSDDNQHLIFTDKTDTLYGINIDFTHLEKLPLTTDLEKILYRMQLLKTRKLRGLWYPEQNHSPYYYELSPDGKWLAYLESGTFPNNLCRQIRIMNTETGENYFILDREGLVPYLLNNSPNNDLKIISTDSVLNSSQFGHLMWSPDSQQLLFTHSYQDLNAFEYGDLFAINLDGTGLHLIMDDVWYPEIQP